MPTFTWIDFIFCTRCDYWKMSVRIKINPMRSLLQNAVQTHSKPPMLYDDLYFYYYSTVSVELKPGCRNEFPPIRSLSSGT